MLIVSKRLFATLASSAAALTLTVSPALAAPTFNVESLSTDGSELDTSNVQQELFAWNTGGGTNTFGGITFQGSLSGTYVTSGSATNPSGSTNTAVGDSGPWDGTVMDSNATSENASNSSTLANGPSRIAFESLINLTDGQRYRVQTLHLREFDEKFFDMYLADVSGQAIDSISETPLGSISTGLGGGSGAKLATVEFTASGTSQAVSFVPQGTGGNRATLSGIVVQAIPEPSAAALMAIGGGLVLARTRRQRA
jgi:hypothetical protein